MLKNNRLILNDVYNYTILLLSQPFVNKNQVDEKYTTFQYLSNMIAVFYYLFLSLFTFLYKRGRSQCPEIILNEIEKTFNKTYIELKSFLQRFQIRFSQNPSCKGMESTSQAAVPIGPTEAVLVALPRRWIPRPYRQDFE